MSPKSDTGVDREAERNREVTAAAEAFLEALRGINRQISEGLADRPRPGAKAQARDAHRALLHEIHRLRMVVELTKPVRIVASEAQELERP